MATLPPRAVFVTRQSEYDYLLARHATPAAPALVLRALDDRPDSRRQRRCVTAL